MTTMNISLPESLKAFVDEQVNGFDTSSEYVRDMICKDQDRQQLRILLQSGDRLRLDVPLIRAILALYVRVRVALLDDA